MRFLVDGHNLIPHLPGFSLQDLDDEQRLIDLLQPFANVANHTIEVFFDKAPPGHSRQKRYGKVVAHFVQTGVSADEAIIQRLQKFGKSAANWQVVSSDRRVQIEARARQAKIITSDAFAKILDQAASKSPEMEKPSSNAPLNAAQIDDWLNLFSRGK